MDAVSTALWHTVQAALCIRSIGVSVWVIRIVAVIAEFEFRLHDAIATLCKRNPLTGVVTIVITIAVAVITLFIESGLNFTVSTVRFVTRSTGATDVIATNRTVRTELPFRLTKAVTTVSVTDIAVITFFTCLNDRITTERQLRDLAGYAAV